jgi:hypothetical protein
MEAPPAIADHATGFDRGLRSGVRIHEIAKTRDLACCGLRVMRKTAPAVERQSETYSAAQSLSNRALCIKCLVPLKQAINAADPSEP